MKHSKVSEQRPSLPVPIIQLCLTEHTMTAETIRPRECLLPCRIESLVAGFSLVTHKADIIVLSSIMSTKTCYGYNRTESFHRFRGLSKCPFLLRRHFRFFSGGGGYVNIILTMCSFQYLLYCFLILSFVTCPSVLTNTDIKLQSFVQQSHIRT
jgi:hypothetical protein